MSAPTAAVAALGVTPHKLERPAMDEEVHEKHADHRLSQERLNSGMQRTALAAAADAGRWAGIAHGHACNS